MTSIIIIIKRSGPALLTLLLLTLATHPASGQYPAGCGKPLGGATNNCGFFKGCLERDMPGFTDPGKPMVFPPVFRGEVRFRPTYIIGSGKLEDTVTDQSWDLASDLLFDDPGFLVESIARVQIGRYSFRAHYDTYVDVPRGARSRLDWPEFRAGFDLDVFYSPIYRFGVNLDYYAERPYFVLRTDALGSRKLAGQNPVTAGVHASYQGINCGGLSGSFESRFSVSLAEDPRVWEADVAAGFRGPELMTGTVGFRGGWRYMKVEMEEDELKLNLDWNGIFVEIFYLY
ncbi:hypothetical protein ACFL2Q_13350 [Thermodesulfobacteriota bacterium]